MDALISVLGFLISIMMDLAKSKTSDEFKKAKLAKDFVEVFNLLGEIIIRGNKILDALDVLFTSKDKEIFIERLKSLYELVNRQFSSLNELNRTLTFFSDNIIGRELYDMNRAKTNVQKVLSIYEPDFGPYIQNVILPKETLLRSLAMIFKDNIDKFATGKFIIREVVEIPVERLYRVDQLSSLLRSSYYLGDNEENNQIIYKVYDLAMPHDRGLYISRARSRLQDLENGRQKLAKLIREHYEPHHLI